METDWELGMLIQLLLWPEDWLEALTVEVPKKPVFIRRVAPASTATAQQAPLPLEKPEPVIDAAYCGRKIQSLRRWRNIVYRHCVAVGVPTRDNKLLSSIDTRILEWVQRLWSCWGAGAVEMDTWEKAS